MEAYNNELYAGNILVSRLGSIPAPMDMLRTLIWLPEKPVNMAMVPKHIRAHQLLDVLDFHFPSSIELQLLQTTDLMIRKSYKYRDPRLATTWGAISGEVRRGSGFLAPALAASVEGLSGVGKTQASLRCLRYFPQIIRHEEFPRLEGGLSQTVWLSVEAPPSGKSSDMARALMTAWKDATQSSRFDHWLGKDKIVDGMRALDEWRQVANSHFLGVLHLDEVQNLFKLGSLKHRRDRKGAGDVAELSIVEDQLLRWLLHLNNSGQISLLFSGTPDGIGALTRRLSTLERINTCGYHPFDPIVHQPGRPIDGTFLGQLSHYQYVPGRITMDDQLVNLIIELTGGIQRLVIALWVAAHRVAFARSADDLSLEDFTKAASTWLAPIAPAVAALRSGDATRMGRYEDLSVRDTIFWERFWQGS